MELFLYGFLSGCLFMLVVIRELKSKAPWWRWLLLPLSPIAILIGLIVGLNQHFKKKRDEKE